MFNLTQWNTAGRPIFKCDFIRYTPPWINLLGGENNQILSDIPLENSANSLKDR